MMNKLSDGIGNELQAKSSCTTDFKHKQLNKLNQVRQTDFVF